LPGHISIPVIFKYALAVLIKKIHPRISSAQMDFFCFIFDMLFRRSA